jgi:hypothetical protein
MLLGVFILVVSISRFIPYFSAEKTKKIPRKSDVMISIEVIPLLKKQQLINWVIIVIMFALGIIISIFLFPKVG